MNANTEVTLDQVHDGILAAIRAQFPALATVEAYLADRTALPVPACLVDMTRFDDVADSDPGTGQLAVMASFKALLVMGTGLPGQNMKLEIRKLAAAFAAFVRLQRWGCPIGPAKLIGAFPDETVPELDPYDVWRVEWQQLIHLGHTVWTDDGAPPAIMMGSHSPLIGAAHVDQYRRINL